MNKITKKKIQKRNEILQSLKEAFLEVKQARKEGRKLQTLEAFLKELESEK